MSHLPEPSQVFKRRPLADDVVIRWSEMLAYFQLLADGDSSLTLHSIGSDWTGQPLVMLSLGGRAPSPARTALAITAGIHANELGGPQSLPGIVFELLTTPCPELAAARDRIDILIVPCVNPSGLEMVADWRERMKGTPFEVSEPPGQTHPIGHDLNRDWIMQTQPETRAVAAHVFNRWRPAVVVDLHEMPPNGPRYALPPYVEPIDHSIPPAIRDGAARFGRSIAAQMAREGKTGVAAGLIFDALSPARAYPPYHGAIRILAEAAGTRLGRPLQLSADELASGRRFDPREATPDHPNPWPGGRWSLADVGAYHRTAVIASIIEAANADDPMTTPTESAHFIILPMKIQRDPRAARVLLDVLQRGDARVDETHHPIALGGVEIPAGARVIGADQRAWPWAKTLLSVQRYASSERFDQRPPYDVVAQTLPLLMGVDVLEANDARDIEARPARGAKSIPTTVAPAATVGVYASRRPDATEAGWAVTMLNAAEIGTTRLDDPAVRAGDFDGLDVILLPHQRPDHLIDGLNLAEYPSEFTGGIGNVGVARLKDWVRNGGTLIAIDGAGQTLIRAMRLPVEIVDEGFSAPGSILRVELDLDHRVARGCESEMAIMSRSSPAFAIDRRKNREARVVARYPADDPLLSGWLSGWKSLAGRAAIVEQPVGAGFILLFGCRPLFRGQTLSSQRLVENAILHARKART